MVDKINTVERLRSLDLPLPIFNVWDRDVVVKELDRLGYEFSCEEVEISGHMAHKESGKKAMRSYDALRVEMPSREAALRAAFLLLVGYGPTNMKGERIFAVKMVPPRMQRFFETIYAAADKQAEEMLNDEEALAYGIHDYGIWSAEIRDALANGKMDRANQYALIALDTVGALARVRRFYDEVAELEEL